MLRKHDYPIMEFDTAKDAKLNPANFVGDEKFSTNKMVITFFPEVINQLLEDKDIEAYYTIGGENPVYIYKFTDNPDVLITLGQVGCPACAGNLDLFHEFGIDKVMFCGGGGVLDRNIEVGQLLVVDAAIRDEGFSYHYLEPSRLVFANKDVNDKICKELEDRKINYLRGLVWTTDAIFRETVEKIELRKEEGAKIVEMEQAGCLAVAQFRGFDYGALIYGGDDVASEEWSNRDWRHRGSIRYNLVCLCKELVSTL